VDDVDAHHGVEFDRWLSLSLFHWLSNRHNNPVYKATTMPPAAEESHPPPGVPNEPEDPEAEESDEYDIADDDEYAGEDDEEEGEPSGRQANSGLTALLLGETAGPDQGEDDDDDDEYSDDAEGNGRDSSTLSSVKRGRDREDEGQDVKKVKV